MESCLLLAEFFYQFTVHFHDTEVDDVGFPVISNHDVSLMEIFVSDSVLSQESESGLDFVCPGGRDSPEYIHAIELAREYGMDEDIYSFLLEYHFANLEIVCPCYCLHA